MEPTDIALKQLARWARPQFYGDLLDCLLVGIARSRHL